jgi:hypothetical protein
MEIGGTVPAARVGTVTLGAMLLEELMPGLRSLRLVRERIL